MNEPDSLTKTKRHPDSFVCRGCEFLNKNCSLKDKSVLTSKRKTKEGWAFYIKRCTKRAWGEFQNVEKNQGIYQKSF